MIEDLIKKLCTIDKGHFVINNDYAVGEMKIISKADPAFKNNVLHLSHNNWTIHLNLSEIKKIQFRKEKEPSGFIPYLLFVSFSTSNDKSILSFFFPNPYLDDNNQKTNFQKSRQDVFDALKSEYEKVDMFDYIEK